MTNFGFEREMQRLGVGFERANVGDRYVLEQMQNRGWLYGGESSGHLLCLDCHTTGDGIIAALQVLTALRRNQATMSEWLGELRMYPQKMINVRWRRSDWKTHAGLSAARQSVEAELAGRGRILIRASGTEPAAPDGGSRRRGAGRVQRREARGQPGVIPLGRWQGHPPHDGGWPFLLFPRIDL